VSYYAKLHGKGWHSDRQVILRNFEFETLPTKPQIVRVAPNIVMRPVVVGEESKGIQMPVLVRRLEVE
jgi:hypothetical protein